MKDNIKLDDWHQLGPLQQSASIIMSMEGWIYLIEMYPDMLDEILPKLRRNFDEMKALCFSGLPDKWAQKDMEKVRDYYKGNTQ
jgi:hypothetical protein